MSNSELTTLVPRDLRDRFLTPILVAIGLFAVLAILGYDIVGLFGLVSPVWVALVVFAYLGYRFVLAVERIAAAME